MNQSQFGYNLLRNCVQIIRFNRDNNFHLLCGTLNKSTKKVFKPKSQKTKNPKITVMAERYPNTPTPIEVVQTPSGSFKVYNNYNNFYHGDSENNSTRSNEPIPMRMWIRRPTIKDNIENEGLNFKVMSYNILSQELLAQTSFLYQTHDQRALNWTHRFNCIIHEIYKFGPKILCLQEVQHDHLRDIHSALKGLNYQYVYKRRTGGKPDGCAIFFDTELFYLIDDHTIELYQPKVNLLDRGNVSVIVTLGLKNHPATKLIVCTTHLLYNPRREDIRLAQTQIILAELDRLSKSNESNNKRLPIIFTGDFNLESHSPTYQLVTSGYVRYEHLSQRRLELSNQYPPTGPSLLPSFLGITDHCQHLEHEKRGLYHSRHNRTPTYWTLEKNSEHKDLFGSGTLSHKLNLKSTANYEISKGDEASTYHNKWITVDYVFYTPDSLNLLAHYQLPTVDECFRMGPIPNRYLGSDHLCLVARFNLSYQTKTKL